MVENNNFNDFVASVKHIDANLETIPDLYYLEENTIPQDSDDDNLSYEEVFIEHFSESECEESLVHAVKSLKASKKHIDLINLAIKPPRASLIEKPEIVEDFVRNYLVEAGLHRTLATFQEEWHFLAQKDALKTSIEPLPDCYSQNRELQLKVDKLLLEVNKQNNLEDCFSGELIRLRKERDFHRMHHKRLLQEKDKQSSKIKHLKSHISNYEPTLKKLNDKYETAIRSEMMAILVKDRALQQVYNLQIKLESFINGEKSEISSKSPKL